MNNKKSENPQIIMICGNYYTDMDFIVNRIKNRIKNERFLIIKVLNPKKTKIIFFNNKKIRKKIVKNIEKIKFFKLKNENKTVIIENRLHDVLKNSRFLVEESDVIFMILEPNLLGIISTCEIISKLKNLKKANKNGLHIVVKKDVKNSVDFFVLKKILKKKFHLRNVKKIKFDNFGGKKWN